MNKAVKKRLSVAAFIVGVLLLAAALFLVGFNLWESDLAGRSASTEAEKVKTAIVAEHSPRVIDGTPCVSVEGKGYVGIICVPSLGLELPVAAEWSETQLKKTPCRYGGSLSGADMVIAGHNYASHFGRLGSLTSGERVIFIAADGVRHDYSVDCIEELAAEQVDEMKSGDWALTLFTCTPSGGARIAVRCVEG